MTRPAPIIAVFAAACVGATTLACFASAVMLFARMAYGDGGDWGALFAMVIATGASWPACRLVWPVNSHPVLWQLALIGIAQWTAIGGIVGFGLGLAMTMLSRFKAARV